MPLSIDGAKTRATRSEASEDRQLMLQRNALPNQRSTGSMICPRKEARFAAERGRNKREERRLDTRLLTVADVETLIAAALWAERQAAVVSIIGEAVNELLDAEREHAKSRAGRTCARTGIAGCQARGRIDRPAAGIERGARQDNRLAECVAGRELSPLLRPTSKRHASSLSLAP